MPRYQLTSPQGENFEITAPEGASEQEVYNYFMQNYQQQAPEPVAPPQQPQMPEISQPSYEQTGQAPTAMGPIDDGTPDMAERAPQKRVGFMDELGGIGEDWQRRQQIVDETEAARQRGEMGGITALTTPIGQAAGFGMDVIGRGLEAATPEFVEEGAGAALKWLGGTRPGQAVGGAVKAGMEAYGEFEEQNPTLGRVGRDVANVAMLATPTRAKPKLPSAEGKGALGKFAESIDVGKKRDQRVQDMVLPYESAKRKAKMEPRTTEQGLTRKGVYDPTDFEKKQAQDAINLSGVNPNKSARYNHPIFTNAVNKEGARLAADLEKFDILIPKPELSKNIFSKLEERIKLDPDFVGEAGEVARRVGEQFDRILAKHPGTPSGLLAARKEFDAYVRGKKQNYWKNKDDKNNTPFSEAVDEIRNTTNEFLSKKAKEKGIDVDESLRLQTSYYASRDNLLEKAAKSANTAWGRFLERVNKQVTLKRMLVGAAGLGGVAAAGAAQALVPLAFTGSLIYAGGKALTSDQARKMLRGTLKTMDYAAQTGKMGADALQKIKADRALFQDYLEGLERGEYDEAYAEAMAAED